MHRTLWAGAMLVTGSTRTLWWDPDLTPSETPMLLLRSGLLCMNSCILGWCNEIDRTAHDICLELGQRNLSGGTPGADVSDWLALHGGTSGKG